MNSSTEPGSWQRGRGEAPELRAAGALSLRRGVAWATAGNAVYLAFQYGMMVAIAKLGTPRQLGEFALAQALAAPVIVLSQFQLRQLQVTDSRNSARFADYLTLRTVAALAAVMVILVVALASGYRSGALLVILGVAVAKACESVSDIAHGRLQKGERMDLVARSLAAKGVLSFAALALVLWVSDSLAAAVLAMALVWGLLLVTYDLPLARSLGSADRPLLEWRPTVLRGLVGLALPLSAAAGLASLSSNLPRYFLEATIGPEAVGMFAVAATPLVLLGLLNAAVTQGTLPRAAAHFQAGELAPFGRIARRVVALQVAGGLAVAALFAVAGRPLLTLLFSPEYAVAAPVAALMALGVAGAGLGAWGSTVVTAGRRFHLQLWNVLFVLLVQVPLCALLIGHYGVLGGGWTEFARYLLSAAFFTAVGVRVYRDRAASAPRAGNWNGS